VKVKWWREPENFGDVLTPKLLEHFNIKYEYVDDVNRAEAIVIGSIARLALAGQKVYGSGCIRKNETLNPKVIWKFVRGPLTRQQVLDNGGSCPEIYGDAALLLPDFCPAEEKKYKIGVVPHYSDYGIIKHCYPEYKVIDVVGDPIRVAKEISSCEYIISSSLHGIIAAHAYGIPAAWVKWGKLWGDDTKFYDYFASVGIDDPPISESGKTPTYIDPGKIDMDPVREIFNENL